MKKYFALLLAVLMVASLIAGCSQPAPAPAPSEAPSAPEQPAPTADQPAPAPEQPAEKIKVALLLAGPISDQGWNASAYAGLKMIEDKLGAEVNYTESVQQSDMEENFRNYASAGYNVVIGHGYQFGDAAQKVATEFPNVYFAVTSSSITQAPNLASINNNNVQQGFLAGAFCAYMSKSGKVAAINGMEITSIINFDRGFKNGAEYAVPGISAETVFTGDFYDAAKAKEFAFAQINNGVDIIAHDADTSGIGVIEAAAEKGIYAVGAITDQNALAPETVVVSALSDLSSAIFVFVKDVAEGKFEAKSYMMGIAEECVGLSPYYDSKNLVSQDVKDKMDAIIKGILDGSINADVGPGSAN